MKGVLIGRTQKLCLPDEAKFKRSSRPVTTIQYAATQAERSEVYSLGRHEVRVLTPAGPIRIPDVEVFEADAELMNALLSNELLADLNIDVDAMLIEQAKSVNTYQAPAVQQASAAQYRMEMEDEEVAPLGEHDPVAVRAALDRAVSRAVLNGLPEDLRETLHNLLIEYEDVFRLKLGNMPASK